MGLFLSLFWLIPKTLGAKTPHITKQDALLLKKDLQGKLKSISPLSMLGDVAEIGMLTNISCAFLHFLASLQVGGATGLFWSIGCKGMGHLSLLGPIVEEWVWLLPALSSLVLVVWQSHKTEIAWNPGSPDEQQPSQDIPILSRLLLRVEQSFAKLLTFGG